MVQLKSQDFEKSSRNHPAKSLFRLEHQLERLHFGKKNLLLVRKQSVEVLFKKIVLKKQSKDADVKNGAFQSSPGY